MTAGLVLWLVLIQVDAEARDPQPCLPKTALRKVLWPDPKIERLTDSVDILYYPKAGYHLMSHVELRVKDKVWSQLASTHEKASYEIAERKARQGGFGFYRFRIRTTPEETEALQKYLQARSADPEKHIQSCVSGVCRSLNRAGILYVPPPFSKMPLLNAVYLRLRSLLGASRIESVHFIGKSQLRALASSEVLVEANVANHLYLLGAMVVELIDQNGRRVLEWIGIEPHGADPAGAGPKSAPVSAPGSVPAAAPTPFVSPR